jgi:hypothetical protein
MTCPWRYNFSYEQYMTTKQIAEPLFYGSGFHIALEYIYGDKGNPKTSRTQPKMYRGKLKREGYEGEDLETMSDYVQTYVDHMRRHPSQEPSEVIANEFAFEVPMDMGCFERLSQVYNTPWTHKGDIAFIGIMDLIVIRRKMAEIWDHKLQSNHPRVGELDHPSISYPQMGIYAWATQHLGRYIKRSVLNVFGKRRKTGNVQRYPLLITEKEAGIWGLWLHEKVFEMLTTQGRAKNLGSMYCGFCSWRYACSKHQAEGDDGLTQALAIQYEKKEYDHRASKKWLTEFPPSMLEKMEGFK